MNWVNVEKNSSWTIPLFRLGTKRKIQLSDLYKSRPVDKSEFLGDKLQKYWEKELIQIKGKPYKKPSLLRALFKTFIWDYLLCGLYLFLQYVALR